jgi:hypothetical protein
MSVFLFGIPTNGKTIYLSMFVFLFGIPMNGKTIYLYARIIPILNFVPEFYMLDFKFYACIITILNLYA